MSASTRLVMYGDFTCPWSYLAARRAGVLAADGVEVDWRAVEHDPAGPGQVASAADRFATLRDDLERVQAHLRTGERFPYTLAGFVPHTKPAVSGYAEAYGAGVADVAGPLLLEAYWLHGIDLGDAIVVRTLLVDAIRSGASASPPLTEWGYAVTRTGTPITSAAHRRLGQWRADWHATGKQVVPTLIVDDERPVFGADVLDRLADELDVRGLDADHEAQLQVPSQRRCTDMPARSWASQHGGRWIRPYQEAIRG